MKITSILSGLLPVALLSCLLGGTAAGMGWPDLSQPAKATGGGEHDAAVIVGVENYFAVPGVPGAKSNATDWYGYLTETRGVPPQNVKLLTNEDATREGILESAHTAAGLAGKDGTLWFVFIGHGVPSADGKDGLLVGVDAQQKAESLQDRSVRRGELLSALSASPTGSIRVVLDACFSGRGQDGVSIAPGLQPLMTVAAMGAVDPRMVVLTAAKGNQFAGALPSASRPAFSYLVLGGLRGWAAEKDGNVTAGSLWRYAKNALAATLRGRDQTPDLIGSESAVLAASAGEVGPNLAKLAVATTGSRVVKVTSEAKAASVSTGKVDIQWVTIPGGTFMMGSDLRTDIYSRENERPLHVVTIKPFEIAKTLVTNRQYRACIAAGSCTLPSGCSTSLKGDDLPVVCLRWNQADEYSKWIGGRLPTEAEWEYAARGAGQEQSFPWGNEKPDCTTAAIACGNLAPVCSKPSGNTKQGLCDMGSNVREWVQDIYSESYNDAPSNGSAREDLWGQTRVTRGGAYGTRNVSEARAAHRGSEVPARGQETIGFRPAR